MTPILGVLFLGWSVFPILLLYWLETAIVFFFNSLKIMKAQGNPPPITEQAHLSMRYPDGTSIDTAPSDYTKAELVQMSIGWCGAIMAVFGWALLTVFRPRTINLLNTSGVVISFLGLCIGHWLSYRVDYLGKGEFKTISPSQQFSQPFSRLFMIMFATFGVGGGITYMGTGSGLLVMLIMGKTIFDLYAHVLARKKAAGGKS